MNKGSKIILAHLLLLLLISSCRYDPTIPKDLIQVNSSVFTFPDGENVSTWRYPNDNKLLYLLDDGTELLAVYDIDGPENTVVEGVASINDLEKAAQDNIIAFYEQQGPLYNTEEYLKKAYAEYTAGEPGSTFRCYSLIQKTFPNASNEKIIYFTTNVLLPLEQEVYEEYNLTRAFDKKSGSVIDGWDLFAASENEVKSAFLSDYTTDLKTKNALFTDFRPEYIRLFSDHYEIIYPCETSKHLNGEGDLALSNISMGGEYTDEMISVLHAWAIPD